MEILTTEDNISLAAHYVQTSGDKAVILLHQYSNNKESYLILQDALLTAGISSIAIDFRGHGKSEGKFLDFTDTDFQSMILDVKEAHKFLKNKNKKRIGIIGASIGANTAINFCQNADEIKACIALSPGIIYHGIQTIRKKPKAKIMIIVSKDDVYSYESSIELQQNLNAKLIEHPNKAHGVYLLNSDVIQDIILFLNDNL